MNNREWIKRRMWKELKMEGLEIREISAADNEELAALIRENLKKLGLDVPGTAYFDEKLDRLSDCYGTEKSRYYVLTDLAGAVLGGAGFSGCPALPDTAELQKLYLTDAVKGQRLGERLLRFIENEMQRAGYKKSYLETHDNLRAAIHLYRKCGYQEIERPKAVAHGTMNRFFIKELYWDRLELA